MADKVKKKHPQKELFKRLRTLSCEELWEREVAQFNAASPAVRAATVAVIRAVGVVLGESDDPVWRAKALPWVLTLLNDPSETVRRYAITALPRIGAGREAEQRLLQLQQSTLLEKEKQTIAEALQKIGGTETLARLESQVEAPDPLTEQKIRARLARDESASAVRLDQAFNPQGSPLVLALRCREGLEDILRDEVAAHPLSGSTFRLGRTHPGLVELQAIAPFTLAQVFTFRTFDTLHLVLGQNDARRRTSTADELAGIITHPVARRLFETFTTGPWRYRLDFIGQGHQRQAVREIGKTVYGREPRLLNDARHAPWTVHVRPQPSGPQIELSPRGVFDPRFAYRRGDIPAASHPPLAAALARLGGAVKGDIVWDPFCGSGQELVERARLGPTTSLLGSDLSTEALEVAERNWSAAALAGRQVRFAAGDFRDSALGPELSQKSITLLLTNPPMGRRIPVADIRGLVRDLFATAERVLAPGGRFVLVNPLNEELPTTRLKQVYRRKIDLGGFYGWLEKYEG